MSEHDTLKMPFGRINPDDLSTQGAGAGASQTDTGGLDADGNELGAASPGSDNGRAEAQRMDDADAGANDI